MIERLRCLFVGHKLCPWRLLRFEPLERGHRRPVYQAICSRCGKHVLSRGERDQE